jgi:signal peptidase I
VPRFSLHPVLTVSAILAAALCLAMCFEIAVVPTASMEGTVLVGDHLFVSKVLDGPLVPGTTWRLPRWGKVRRGQIVSFRAPGQEAIFLKRVVAVSGEAVEMRGGVLYVNDVPVTESYAAKCKYRADVNRQVVPPGDIYVMGDNRDNSEDSRAWGPVPVRSVVGKPLFVLWSVRTRAGDWLDAKGQPTNAFYWTGLRHLVASTRWTRTGTRL